MAETPLPPGSTIGILGGGQLGRMLACAAAALGFRSRIFCEKPDAPAFDVAASHVCAPYDDTAALDAFARECDVITFEFENVPVAAVEAAGGHAPVHPGARALRVTQDRLAEKEFLAGLSIATAAYRPVESTGDLARAVEEIGRPAIVKTRRLGYDGKGQVRIGGDDEAARAYAQLGEVPAILEGFVAFEREVSVVAARSRDGDLAVYDLAENRHENQILKETRVPADAPEETGEEARAIAARVGEALGYVGVFCVEMFHCGPGAPSPLLVNEIAPRVHNSGHWTLDACAVSQFENHVRAIAGWPLGPAQRHCDAVMTNLIGDDVERWAALAADPQARLHLYGKREPRPGRKMGHVTRVLPLGSG